MGLLSSGWKAIIRQRAVVMAVMFCLLFVFSQATALVDALSPAQKQLFDSGVNYFDTDPCGIASSASDAPTQNGSVFILGDSITVRAEQDYQKAFQAKGVTVNIDGSSSRSLSAPGKDGNKLNGMDAITKDASQIGSASAIVIALGTNGGDTPSSIDKAIAAIKAIKTSKASTAPIYWVDTIAVGRADDSIMGPQNKAIYGESASQDYQVISWFKTVDPSGDPKNPAAKEKDPNKYIDNSDGLGVHPTAAGSSALAKLVSGAVTSDTGAPPQHNTITNQLSGCCDNGAPSADTALTGSDNLGKAFNFFVQTAKYTPAQAAGIVASISNESGGDPENIQDPGGRTQDPAAAGGAGWGIVQWTPGSNVPAIQSAANVSGPVYALSTQLQILWAQLEGRAGGYSEKQAGDDLKATNTPQDAAEAFVGDTQVGGHYIGFERPKDEAAALADRKPAAVAALQKYGGGSSSGASQVFAQSGGCASSNGGAVQGDLVQTVINYAWPDYHPAVFTDKKPAYAAAITKAKSEGRYVGTDGIDCGGFVTTVMVDSGWDPDYNNTKQYKGDVAVQYAYLKSSSKWKQISPSSTADLQPGDVWIEGGFGHTLLYVGKHAGFNGIYASASTGPPWRAPMADSNSALYSGGYWFRKTN